MVRIPSLSRRPETAPTRDENRDGRIDERDERSPVTGPNPPPSVNDPTDDLSTYRSRSALDTPTEDTHPIGAHRQVGGATAERSAAERAMDRADRPTERVVAGRAPIDRTSDLDEAPVVDGAAVGPRPRASVFATLSLIVGVGAALFVLSGVLAGYGIALGVLAVLLAVVGVSATRRRHVAGKSDALLGLLLGLGAIVVGALAFAGALPWLTPDTDTAARLREWLDTQFVNRF